ncbi:MAG: HEPN domain-containing protein [Nitrospinae bacterium]|nr:HEPN domain-containing protein [Nitrospinota bacterium]
MGKKPLEWFKQADYDLKTAEYLFKGKRYVYTVFMCHLSIEKTLKGLYQEKLNKLPPKVHNLIYLIEKIGLELPDDLFDWISALNRLSIPTRYPEDLKEMQKDYNKDETGKLV